MKCPLHVSDAYHNGKETQIIYAECLQEECAWWIESEKQCSITTLALEASYKLWDRDSQK